MSKRRPVSMLLIAALMVSLFLTGCSNANNSKIEELAQQIEELKKENTKIKEELENLKNNKELVIDEEIYEDADNGTGNTSESKISKGIKEVVLDETIVIDDFAEVTIKKVEFTKRVNPPKPDSFYSYYEVKEDGLTYLHVIAQIKNLQAYSVYADEFVDIKAKYNNKYVYDSFSTIEELGGGDLTYSSITGIDPLKNGMVHFLIEVPLEVEAETSPLELNIYINGINYLYKIR